MNSSPSSPRPTRRQFLHGVLAAATAPYFVPARALGRDGAQAASNRLTVGCIGVGGRGEGDMKSFLSFPEVRVVAVCDVHAGRRERAKAIVDGQYGDTGCTAHNDFREITGRADIDAVMIATPDHWHVTIAVDAMRNGKDVFCEKPETLTVREGRELVDATKRFGRVFSGGSQRVWGDYNWFHRMVRGGAIGDVQDVYVNVSGSSRPCTLPAQPVPAGLDWDLWLGPAPMVPFNAGRLNFRAWRDYSGGGMTDWGAHGFGGALFACGLHETGPVEITVPDGPDHPYLTYRYANGIRLHHGGPRNGILHFKGTKGEIATGDEKGRAAPNLAIPNYKGSGGIIGDFLHCVRSRELPFRNAEAAHRTVTVCHLGNIAYWLNRSLKWDPVREEIVGDDEAARWLSRPRRAPWGLA